MCGRACTCAASFPPSHSTARPSAKQLTTHKHRANKPKQACSAAKSWQPNKRLQFLPCSRNQIWRGRANAAGVSYQLLQGSQLQQSIVRPAHRCPASHPTPALPRLISQPSSHTDTQAAHTHAHLHFATPNTHYSLPRCQLLRRCSSCPTPTSGAHHTTLADTAATCCLTKPAASQTCCLPARCGVQLSKQASRKPQHSSRAAAHSSLHDIP